MKTYQDRNTFWHDKECFNGEPRSNNKFIYTAYSKYLTKGSINMSSILKEYNKCTRSLSPVIIDRTAGRTDFPISKDEIIGTCSLGLLTRNELQNSHWNFCNLEGNFDRKLTFKSLITAAKALYKIRKEHRNYFWQNKMVETYPLAFWLPWWDQYYINRQYNKKSSLIQYLAFYANAIMTLTKGNKSVKMLLWLQLSDMNHWLLKFVPKKKYVEAYFEEGHPFREGNE